MLRACDIAIAHEGNVVAIDADDAMHHIVRTVDPGENHVTDFQLRRLLHDDALLTTDDKRQHAAPVNGEGDAHPLAHQPDGFFYDLFTFHLSLLHCKVLPLPHRAGTPDATSAPA